MGFEFYQGLCEQTKFITDSYEDSMKRIYPKSIEQNPVTKRPLLSTYFGINLAN